jgi:hypothetical protein
MPYSTLLFAKYDIAFVPARSAFALFPRNTAPAATNLLSPPSSILIIDFARSSRRLAQWRRSSSGEDETT